MLRHIRRKHDQKQQWKRHPIQRSHQQSYFQLVSSSTSNIFSQNLIKPFVWWCHLAKKLLCTLRSPSVHLLVRSKMGAPQAHVFRCVPSSKKSPGSFVSPPQASNVMTHAKSVNRGKKHVLLFNFTAIPKKPWYVPCTHWGKTQLLFQKLPRIWYLKNVYFVKNETLKMWILWKMRL